MRTLPQRLVFATTNRGKLAEVRAILAGKVAEILAATDVLRDWRLEETGTTFEENARAKACDLASRTSLPALGDDSGLEVAALGGRPGVRSARYAGEGATDAANVARLLAELQGVPAERRRAAFRCVVALAWPEGEVVVADGRCEGTIAFAPRGSSGFGYDPLFIDPATGRTFAELSAAEKHRRSHRGRALAALCRKLGAAGAS